MTKAEARALLGPQLSRYWPEWSDERRAAMEPLLSDLQREALRVMFGGPPEEEAPAAEVLPPLPDPVLPSPHTARWPLIDNIERLDPAVEDDTLDNYPWSGIPMPLVLGHRSGPFYEPIQPYAPEDSPARGWTFGGCCGAGCLLLLALGAITVPLLILFG
ncbi:MAG: hypothetical protein WC381_11640 [Kiritimatiellia bacterium]